MDRVHVLRHKVLVEGLSVRRVARELGISRNTVRRYVEGATPGERAPVAPPVRPAYEAARQRMEELLTDSPRWTGGKQRLTAARLHELIAGEGHQVGETLVKEYMREWRRQRQEVFVPLIYPPGDLGEVDFFEVLVDVAGRRRKAHLFVMRLMHSGRDFAWLYPRQDQVCFFDGHVRAFTHFGAVPLRLAYDNLKPAVRRILVGAERELNARFAALVNHYLFEPCFARPRTGHDKGGVEARGKGIRWQHLVPIPSGPDLTVLSQELLARIDRQAAQSDVAGRFAEEKSAMLPVAERPFRAACVHVVGTTRRSLAKVAGAVYSVPSRWAGFDVKAYVGVDTVELELPDRSRVVHPRQPFGGRSVDYRHYLAELAHKPQALRQVAAELIEQLGEPFATMWRHLVDASGPKEAARQFARVLDAIVANGNDADGIDAVAARLRRAMTDDTPLVLALAKPVPPPTAVPVDELPPLLATVEVMAGSAADYDALVGGEP